MRSGVLNLLSQSLLLSLIRADSLLRGNFDSFRLHLSRLCLGFMVLDHPFSLYHGAHDLLAHKILSGINLVKSVLNISGFALS